MMGRFATTTNMSQRDPGDLGTQKSSEEGLEGYAMVFCSLKIHTTF